jgi:isopenicillin N synthase-like dioxygenase
VTGSVPTLSLATAARDPDGFAVAFGGSFAEYGFAIVADHGLDESLIVDAWAHARAFFVLPEAVKRAYILDGMGGARGYTAFGVEIAKDATKHDLKEFWHVGRDLSPTHAFRSSMPDNLWPGEVPGFRETFQTLYAAFDVVGDKLLAAVARYLGLAPDWFVGPVTDGNSVMRLLHYPPIPVDAEGIRAEAHEDINLITLLLGAEEAGLQLRAKDGSWLAIDPPQGTLVVNVGDMLQRLTNRRLPSTTHRVVNPPPERRHLPRYSMPFFLHPTSDWLIKTLPECIDDGHPDLYPEPITADDFLQQRLVEIGLKKG